MINVVSTKSDVASKKIMLVSGNFDDTATISRGSIQIDYSSLTADDKNVLDAFVNNIIGTDKNVSIINLPYSSDFSVDYIYDVTVFADGFTEYDYTALSGTSQGYIDDFNALIISLLP